MADFSLGDAAVTTSVDLAGLDAGIADAQGKAESGFASIGDTIGGALKVGVLAAGAAVVAGVAAIGVAAFNVAGDVQTATAEIQSELGTTAEEAEKLGDMALQVWGQNWGDSIADAKDGIVEIARQMKGLSDDELPDATAAAFALRDSFGVEIPEAANAANTLMENFGLTSEQAFDFITKGFQSGLDNSGDFIDTIGEYSTQFANGGSDAGQFFSVLETGMQGGMLGTDKAADAFKEFRVRIQDGSALTADSLKQLGLDADTMLKGLADGTITPIEAFGQVTDALAKTDDKTLAMQAGVGLLGTQFEDLGQSGVFALSTTTTGLNDMAGATDSLNARYNTWPSMWEGIKRSALVALEPLGAQLLSLANEALPVVQAALSGFIAGITTVVDFIIANLPAIQATFDTVVGAIVGVLQGQGGPALDQWATTFQTVQTVITAVMDAIWTVISAILAQLLAFWRANGDEIMAFVSQMWQTIGEIVQVAMELINATIVPALQGIAAFIGDHGAQIQTVLQSAWTIISNLISAALTIIKGVITVALQLIQGDWQGAWETIKSTASSVWENIQAIVSAAVDGLKAQFSLVKDAITTILGPAISAAQGIIAPVAGWFGNISSAIGGVIRWIGDLVAKLNSISIPDWLQGHSPPPLADWFGYIADETERLGKALPVISANLPALTVPEMGLSSARAKAEVTVKVDDRAAGLLGGIIRAVVKDEQQKQGRAADAFIRTK